jgi:Mg-chelatase subunit ChlD
MPEAAPLLADTFAEPVWLVLLALLPAAAWLRIRSAVAESRFRRVTGCALRMVALAALVVVLSGPLAGTYSRYTDVVFALDVSRSVGREAAAQALDFVNRAFAAKEPDARMGLVVFGADAQVEALLRRSADPVRGIAADVRPEGTDIGRAIEVAVGAFPSGEHRRVVLMSDGQQNLGEARGAAEVARSIGVEIVAVPLEAAAVRGEVSVRGIGAPARVNVHEPFHVQVSVHSNGAARAQLLVLRNGTVLRDLVLDLAPGMNVHRFVDEAPRAGLHEYEAIVNSAGDGEQENNRYQAFVEVSGPPKVLHVAGSAEEARFVSEALRVQGLLADELPATAVPGSMHLGGDRSYGAGGYYDTPVERLLPVTMDVKSAVKIPSLAVIFVLDRSGSMGTRTQGEEKLSIARNAALASIGLLNRLDRVGVLAFDDTQEWVVPPTEVGNRRPITERLSLVGAGGSTDLVRALEEAHRVMSEQQAKVKHLIVLSDGLAGSDVSFEAFGERIKADGITVSTVALGMDADRALMARLAEIGEGRYYHTDDPRNVPRIFTSETMVVARDLVVERETRALLASAGEMIRGLDGFPPLGGYQRVFAKPAAQVLLRSDDQEPLLISWRYGLGKAVAFTSDLNGRWGRDWVRWPAFGRFVSQMARWSMRRSGNETMLPEFRWSAQRGEMLVDVLDRDERFVNGLDLQASIAGPDRQTRRAALEQIAPGRYRSEFAVPVDGRYFVSLSGTRGDLRVGPRTFGLAVPYSPEYLNPGVNRALLEELAAITGGAVLPLGVTSLPAILARKPGASAERWRVWRPLLLAALLALLLEVAVRKLVWPESWRERWRRARGRQADEAPEPGYEELRDMIAGVREAKLATLRESGLHDTDDPAVRARLYMTRAGRHA